MVQSIRSTAAVVVALLLTLSSQRSARVDAFAPSVMITATGANNLNHQSLPFGRGHTTLVDATSNVYDDDEESGSMTVIVDPVDVDVIVSDAEDTKSLNRDVLQKQSFVRDANDLLRSIKDGLQKGGDKDDEIEEMKALQQVIDDPSSSASLLSQRIYELLIEKGMRYDLDTDTGALTKTQFSDLTQLLDNRAVKNEFFRLYSFGMQTAATGVLDVETVKRIVEDRLVSRTGLSPLEFDKWLGF
jgi:hypothetical protein